jgi:hypothetical protein
VLEQSKYRTNKLFRIGVYILTGLLLLQPSCYSGNANETAVLTSSTGRPEISNKQPQTVSTPSRQNYLTQEQLTDVSKLVERYHSATDKDKETARFLIEASKDELQKGRRRVAGEGFLEAASAFPTVEALVMAAECFARLDEKDHPEKERRDVKKKDFAYSVKFFETAKKFAEQTSQTKELENYPDLDEHLKCLNSYLQKKDSEQICEYVKDILRDNEIK